MHRHRDFHRHRTSRERRSHPRLLCSGLAEVTWRDARTGRACREIAVMEDFAPAGACLLMGVPVVKDSEVTIAVVNGRTFHGLVRNCRLEQGGYRVGVSFPAADDSAAEYRPEHFLDVSRLDFSPNE